MKIETIKSLEQRMSDLLKMELEINELNKRLAISCTQEQAGNANALMDKRDTLRIAVINAVKDFHTKDRENLNIMLVDFMSSNKDFLPNTLFDEKTNKEIYLPDETILDTKQFNIILRSSRRKDRSVLFLVIGCIMFLAHFFPFIIANSTGIPFRYVTTAGNSDVFDIDYLFGAFDWVLAYSYVLLPALGLFIVGLGKGKWSIVGLGIGTLMLLGSMLVFRIYTDADEFILYMIFNSIALLFPVSLKLMERRFNKKGKEFLIKYKVLCLVAVIGLGMLNGLFVLLAGAILDGLIALLWLMLVAVIAVYILAHLYFISKALAPFADTLSEMGNSLYKSSDRLGKSLDTPKTNAYGKVELERNSMGQIVEKGTGKAVKRKSGSIGEDDWERK